MKLKLTLLTLGLIAYAGINANAETGKAILRGTDPKSTLKGKVWLEEGKGGLTINAKFENAPPGQHGFHIHEFGSCHDDGKAAGGHFNPKGKKHGHYPEDGMGGAHVGDLGNITINDDGTGTLTATLKKVTLSSGKLSVGGRALILHEKPDDFGQPTGNAGGRIACGTIVITETKMKK